MSKEIEQRLAALERGYKAEKEKAEKLEAKLEETNRENKRLRAQAIDQSRQQGHAISALNSMRELHAGKDNPFSNDPREQYAKLRESTLKDKGGMAYYFTDGPTYVGNRYYVGFRNSPKGNQADFIVVIPKDQDPSLQWQAVELAGRDPKTSAPIFRPLGAGAELEEQLSAKNRALEDQFFTNTELNERRREQDQELGRRGARAGAPPAPGAGPNDPKPLEQGAPGGRPSDTQVG